MRYSILARGVVAAALATAGAGCGPYKIEYNLQKNVPVTRTPTTTREHVHTAGIGGGGYFFVTHQMFPCVVDLTGDESIPQGTSRVVQKHEFGQHVAAGFISWLLFGVNAYHESKIELYSDKPSGPNNDIAKETAPVAEAAVETRRSRVR